MVRGKSGDGSGKLSGMKAVRQTLETLGYDVKTQAAKDHIQKEFGLDLSNNKISAYKSKLRSDAGLNPPRGGRANGARGARPAPPFRCRTSR